MTYKPVVRIQEVTIRKKGGYHHPRTRPRKPLRGSLRQHAMHLLQGRITTRDLEMVKAFIGVGMLTRHQIQRLFFGNHAKVASNRLAKLYHYHFLDRSPYWLQDMAIEGFEPCYIYTVAAAGLEVFALHMGMARADIPFVPQRYTLARDDHMLLHDLRISEMFTQLRVGSMAMAGELIWFNERAAILRRGEDELVRPDGVALIRSEAQQAAFFVEMDRGHTNWENKVRFYERARTQSTWQQTLQVAEWQPTRYPPVLCVVPAALAEKVRQVIRDWQPHTTFLVKTWPSFLHTGVFEHWQQVGTAPSRIWPMHSG